MLRISKSNLFQFLQGLEYSNVDEKNRQQQAAGLCGFTKFRLLLISREIIQNSFFLFFFFNNLERLLIIVLKGAELSTSSGFPLEMKSTNCQKSYLVHQWSVVLYLVYKHFWSLIGFSETYLTTFFDILTGPATLSCSNDLWQWRTGCSFKGRWKWNFLEFREFFYLTGSDQNNQKKNSRHLASFCRCWTVHFTIATACFMIC